MDQPAKRKILVVDDDPGMRGLLEALLETAELIPLSASDSQSAAALLEQHSQEIGACLLDLNLEDCVGEDLYDMIRAHNREVPILPMSGCFEAEVRERFARRNIAGIISKPFRANQLIDTVKACL